MPSADIIVTDIDGNRQCAIQVKTRRDIGSDKGWHMRKKHKDIISKTLFYAFVDIGKTENDHPVVFIIPNAVVAGTLKESHQMWLDSPGKNGAKHNNTDMRRLLPDYIRRKQVQPTFAQKFGPGWMDKYRKNWEILKLKSAS